MRKSTKPRLIRAAASDTNAVAIAYLADVEIHAAAESVDGAKSAPTFRVQAYNGGMLRVNAYPLPIVIDLAGLTAAAEITANLHHDQTKIVGHITDHTNDKRSLSLDGIVSGTGAAAAEFVGNAKNKFPWKASVEALPSGRPELIAAGQKGYANGQTFQGPVLIARKSVLRGVAFLTRGADNDTSVTIAAAAADTSRKDMSMEFQQWIEAMGFDPATVTDKQKASLQTKFDAEIKAAAADKVIADKAAAAATAELPAFDADEIKAAASDHLANLDAIFAQYDGEVKADKFAEIRAAASKEAKELKVKALKDRWLTPRYEAELIKAGAQAEIKLVRADRPAGPAIHASTRPEFTGELIEAALAQSAGMPGIEKQFEAKTLDTAHKSFRSRLGLQQVIIMAAEANGYPRRDYKIDVGNLREMLRYAFAPAIHAESSTYSLPTTLSNLANKELLMGYQLGPQYDVWRRIARVKTVTDFKAVTSFRLLDNMEYEQLGPNGEIKHGTLSEESYTRQAKTYAKMFALKREDIINDDMGAFDDIRTRLGAGSSRKFTRLFWTTFMANSSFFTSARGNYITGSTTNLLSDGVGLNKGVVAFKELQTADGKRAGGTPTLMLIPPELYAVATALFASIVPRQAADVNPYAGKYEPVEVDWLSDSSIANNSTTAWYLFQDPAILAPVAVSFLNGNQAPTVESADADFDVLGVQFRGYHDFGVDFAEFLSGIKSKGAA